MLEKRTLNVVEEEPVDVVEKKPLDVVATLNYSRPVNNHSNRWYVDTITCPNGTKLINFENHTVTVPVTDLRGRENLATLDTTGFQTLFSPTSFNTELFLADNNEKVIAQYYEEVKNLLRDLTGADEIVIFDHTFRKHNPACVETSLHREPVLRVHVDQTPVSSHDRIRYHVKDEYWNFKRFQIINVWRPIKNIVYDYPLAMVDFRTVNAAEDLVATELKYPAWLKDRETFAVKYNPKHKWYYWSHMHPDEAIVFKCYDSVSSKLASARKDYVTVKEKCLRDVAGLALHTAFLNESEAALNIKRQSIEVRAIVLHM